MSSLLYAGSLEWLSGAGGTYNVVDGQLNLGDPKAIITAIRAQLTMGSFVSGRFTDNRSVTLQILVQATDYPSLVLAESALRKAINSTTPNTLAWTPDGGYTTVFDTFRGQVTASWSVKVGRANARVLTVEFDALPFGRSDTQRTISGSLGSLQLLDFSQDPEPTYYVSSDTSGTYADITAVPFNTVGTVYAPQTSPAPLEGTACMRADAPLWRDSSDGAHYAAMFDSGTVALDLSLHTNIRSGVYVTIAPTGGITSAILRAVMLIEDGTGATQEFTAPSVSLGWNAWQYVTIDLSSATIDLTQIVNWKLWVDVYEFSRFQNSGLLIFYLGLTRAYPASSLLSSTVRGGVYQLAGVLGDATAPAGIAFDRGGTNTISGFLAYRAPLGATAQAPSLIGLTSNTGTAPAPALFSGTYEVIIANGGAAVTAGTLTITQKIGSTTVGTKTVAISQVSGATKWGVGSDVVTLPLTGIPADVSDVSYTFTYSQTATDVMLCETAGFRVFVPTMTPAERVWIDAATAQGAGGVYAGSASDRTDAIDLLGGTSVQVTNSMSLDPTDDNYLLVYVIDGAATNVDITYYDHYLGERTAA